MESFESISRWCYRRPGGIMDVHQREMTEELMIDTDDQIKTMVRSYTDYKLYNV